MLILLLASAFALSFAPLTQNADLTASLSTPAFVVADYKVTFEITSTGDIPEGATYKYYVLDALTAGNKLFEVELDPAKLTGSAEDDEIALLPHADKFNGKKEIFIDVFRTDGEVPASVLTGGRLSFAFAAKATGVEAVETSADNAKIIFTLDAPLAEEIASTKFVWDGQELTVAKDETANTYSVATTKAIITAAESPYGYFKGADASKSTLPIWVPNEAAPALVIKHLSATKVKGTVTVPTGQKVWIKSGTAEAKELTKEVEATDYEILYTDFAEVALVYFTKTEAEATIIVSIKQSIAKLESVNPTLAWALATDETDKTPLLEASFTDATKDGQKLILVVEGKADVPQTVTEKKVTFAPAALIGESAVIVHTAIDEVVKSRPCPLTAVTFNLANGTATADKQPVTAVMGTGVYKAKPAGLIVVTEGETDYSKGKFYPFTWGTTDIDKATADVLIADWKEKTDKNIEAYVTEKLADPIPATVPILSTKFVVFPKKETPKDDGAFANIASLMAVLLSVLVFIF